MDSVGNHKVDIKVSLPTEAVHIIDRIKNFLSPNTRNRGDVIALAVYYYYVFFFRQIEEVISRALER